MAARAFTVDRQADEAIVTVTWAAATAGVDTFDAFEMSERGGVSDIILDAAGTFGTAVIGLNTGIDTVTMFAAVQPDGTAIAISAAGGVEVRGVAKQVQPVISSGAPTSVVPRLQYRRVMR